MKIVIRLGGSVFCPSGEPDTAYVKKFSEAILKISAKNEIIVVVGGGRMARSYIRSALNLGAGREEADWVGILAARLNAQVLLCSLGKKACKKPAYTLEELSCFCGTGKIIVMGGLRPRQTTDAVAMEAAKTIGADLIVKLTNMDGIFDKDPKAHKDAKLIEKMSPEKLLVMVSADELTPGKSVIVDPVAAKLLAGLKTKMIIVSAADLKNAEAAIEGKKFRGTVVA
jgi:uridylate kinase